MNIPTHWTFTTIGQICTKSQYGWTTKSSEDGEYLYVRITDIKDGEVLWNNVPFANQLPNDISKFLLEEGDILIARSGSTGESALITKIVKPSIFASYLIRFKPIIVLPKFVFYFLKTEMYWEAVKANVIGVAIPNINSNKLSNIPFPLAPLQEQSLIVEKLDKVFYNLKVGKGQILKVKKTLEKFRKSVILEGVMGRLISDMPLSNYKEVIDNDTKHVFSIPSEWELKKFNEVSEINLKGVDPSEYPDLPLIGPNNIEKTQED